MTEQINKEEILENSEISEDAEMQTEFNEEDAAASEYNDLAAKIDELEAAVDELENKLKESKEEYVRLYAEYDNFRKRTAREKTEIYGNATVDCIQNFLTVADSFERSMEFECSDENFKNGMVMIFNQMKDFMAKMNVTEINPLGAEFDPNFHNAVQQLEGTDYAENHVCAVMMKGYAMGDKLIRPAMVAVAKD